MAAQNRHLIFHAEVIWLSRVRVLKRLFELREEANQFVRERTFPIKIIFIR